MIGTSVKRVPRNISEACPAAQQSVDTVSMYSCSDGDREVTYPLLCDFRQDCTVLSHSAA